MNKAEMIEKLKLIDLQIKELQEQKLKLNPFANLRQLSNKAFGEWSEDYVVEQAPNIEKKNGIGRDLISKNLGKIEVKSTRNTKGITFNQIKPQYSNYHLFVIYDIDNIETTQFLVPNDILVNQLKMSKQHNYSAEGNVFTLSDTKANMAILEEYKVSWEELNAKA